MVLLRARENPKALGLYNALKDHLMECADAAISNLETLDYWEEAQKQNMDTVLRAEKQKIEMLDQSNAQDL